MTKRCNACGQVKPEGDFRLRRGRAEGRTYLNPNCRVCEYAINAARRRERRAELKVETEGPSYEQIVASLTMLPASSDEEMEWKLRADCRGDGRFGEPRDPDGVKRAICEQCPVFGQCRELVDLIEVGPLGGVESQSGFWAGETPVERRRRRGTERRNPIDPNIIVMEAA